MKKILFFKSLFLICGITLTLSFYQRSSARCQSLNKSKCPILKGFVIFDPGRPVHFDHVCSELDRTENTWQSYAFFENKKTPVLVLANLVIGWVDFNTKTVMLQMEEIGIKNFPAWAGDRLAFALEMKNVQNRTYNQRKLVQNF